MMHCRGAEDGEERGQQRFHRRVGGGAFEGAEPEEQVIQEVQGLREE